MPSPKPHKINTLFDTERRISTADHIEVNFLKYDWLKSINSGQRLLALACDAMRQYILYARVHFIFT